MRCAGCPYRQRTNFRIGDRVWVRYRGEYLRGVVAVSQGPTPDWVDLYLVVRYRVPSGEILRSLLPDKDAVTVLPYLPPF